MSTALLLGLRRRVVPPRITRPDAVLLVATAALVALGVIAVLNASYFYSQDRFGDPLFIFRKHVVAVALGVACMVVLSQLRLEVFESAARPLLVGGLVLLVAVLVPDIGASHKGAQRWLATAGFSCQPSELVKFILVVYLARWIARQRARIHTVRYGLLPPVLVVGACSVLILLEPDLGTAVLLWILLLAMLFVGGARGRHLAVLGAGLCVGVLVATAAAQYRLERVLSSPDPWADPRAAGFQLAQSFIAFGSGGYLGNGLGASKQRFFLPEVHTDFIFALIGEEIGLVGALLVLALFAVVAFRGLRVAMRHPDPFGSMLAFGITASLLVGAIVNLGVVLGLLPTKGLPLPFLSYGGTATVGALAHVGVLAALSRTTG